MASPCWDCHEQVYLDFRTSKNIYKNQWYNNYGTLGTRPAPVDRICILLTGGWKRKRPTQTTSSREANSCVLDQQSRAAQHFIHQPDSWKSSGCSMDTLCLDCAKAPPSFARLSQEPWPWPNKRDLYKWPDLFRGFRCVAMPGNARQRLVYFSHVFSLWSFDMWSGSGPARFKRHVEVQCHTWLFTS